MIAVGRSVDLMYPLCNSHEPVSEVLPPVRPPSLPPVSLTRGVGKEHCRISTYPLTFSQFYASILLAPHTSRSVVMPPVGLPAFQPMPSLSGVMVAFGRSATAAYSTLNPHGPVSEVVPFLRTPESPSIPPAARVGGGRNIFCRRGRGFSTSFPPRRCMQSHHHPRSTPR